MSSLLPTLFLASVLLFTGCQKDDYEEIIGVCPVVLTTDPSNLSLNVPLDKTVTIRFNTEMNPATINSTSILLVGSDTLPGTVTYSGTTASFNPLLNLEPFTVYTGTVTTSVKDITGNAMQQKYVWTFNTGAAGVNMGSTSRFAILAATGINSTGFSEVHDADMGVSPGLRSSIVGFPLGEVINGSVFAADDLFPSGIPAMLLQAHEDLSTAYSFAQNATSPTVTIISGDLGGRTLVPGIYKSTTTTFIENGNLTLNANGDPNAFWIFQMSSDFFTQGGTGGDVILTGGAQARNIFWQMDGSAILGNSTSFKGTILGATTLRMNANATIDGRLLSKNGTVVLSQANIIHKP